MNQALAVTYDNMNQIIFEKNIKVGSGRLMGVEIIPNFENYQSALITFDEYHQQLGHPHEGNVKLTANYYKISLKGEPKVCENCSKAKNKKTKISKENTKVATQLGPRISFDISYVQATSQGGNNFWLLIIDEYTKHCWSIFLKHKSDLSTEMMSWLFRFQGDYKVKVKFFR